MSNELEMTLFDDERALVEDLLQQDWEIWDRARVGEASKDGLRVVLPVELAEEFLGILADVTRSRKTPDSVRETAERMIEGLAQSLGIEPEEEPEDDLPEAEVERIHEDIDRSLRAGRLNTGTLGPAQTYGNPDRLEHVKFPDGTEFAFSQCDHGSDPGNKEVDLVLVDQGPLIPPWARFPATFNVQSAPAEAFAYRLEEILDEEESRAEPVRADFGAWATPTPMAIAANRARVKGKIVKAQALPMTTQSRLRVETLDEKMQGWAFPAEHRGEYYVFWSDGTMSLVKNTDVHWVKALIRGKDVLEEYATFTSWTDKPFSPGELGITPGNLLRENDKLIKGRKKGYYSLGLMLSPWPIGGIGSLCPYASKGCSTACLNMSGQGEIHWKQVQVGADEEDISWVQEFRKRTTFLFRRNPEAFKEILYRALQLGVKEVARPKTAKGKPNPVYGMELCIRLNTLSDVQWHLFKYKGKSFIEHFPKIMFYDYTKDIKRMEAFLAGRLPRNYYLTFSWSESDAPYAFEVLKRGGSVAVPFDTQALKTRKGVELTTFLPKWWCGFKVIDADISDIRYKDAEFFSGADMIGPRWTEEDSQELRAELAKGRGFICGLRLKGNAARSRHAEAKAAECKKAAVPTSMTGGFVQYADDAGMRPSGDLQKYAGACKPGDKRACGVKPQRGERADQQYVPECDLTNAEIHPDPLGLGPYQKMLVELGKETAKAQSEEGFVAVYKQLQEMGLAE